MKPNKHMRAAIKAGKALASLEKKKTMANICVACNGSGRYDNTGSPKCGACNGTGKVLTN